MACLHFILLFLSISTSVNAYFWYTSVQGQIVCNGIPFKPTYIHLFDQDTDFAVDPHDLLDSAWIDPLYTGNFTAKAEEKEHDIEFRLAIKHNCGK